LVAVAVNGAAVGRMVRVTSAAVLFPVASVTV